MKPKKSTERIRRVRICSCGIGGACGQHDAGRDRARPAVCARTTDVDLASWPAGCRVLSNVVFIDGRAIGVHAGNGRVEQLTLGR